MEFDPWGNIIAKDVTKELLWRDLGFLRKDINTLSRFISMTGAQKYGYKASENVLQKLRNSKISDEDIEEILPYVNDLADHSEDIEDIFADENLRTIVLLYLLKNKAGFDMITIQPPEGRLGYGWERIN